MKPIRIAQVGSGHDHAPAAFKTLQNLKDCFDLIGFAESNPALTVDALYQAVPQYTVDQLLQMDDLDAVAIECEELAATEIALKFARKGIAIYLDKPGSPDPTSFSELICTLKEKQLPFMMGYMYRYNPSVQHALKMAADGEFGEIYSVEAHMSVRHLNEKRQWLDRFPGGMMFFLGCHLIDLVLQFQGKPQEIIPFNTSTGIEHVDAPDLGFAVLRYPHGVSYIKTCAAEANGFNRRQLVICGSMGTYEIKPFEKHVPGGKQCSPTKAAMVIDNPKHGWHNFAKPLDFEPNDRYEGMMRRFAKAVWEGDNPYSYDYELLLHQTLLKCCGV